MASSVTMVLKRHQSTLIITIVVLVVLIFTFSGVSTVAEVTKVANVAKLSVKDPKVSGTAVVQPDGLQNVQNATLGFGAILMLSLMSRTDRQDAIALIASQCDIKISHVIPGVVSEEINEKAYPWGRGLDKLLTPQYMPYLGSWRSHMNTFKYIIDNKIETALIIEDDVDWDINIKAQLTAFAQALRTSRLRRPFTDEELERAPYGLDWDIMHLATSKANMAAAPRNKAFIKYNDPYRASSDVANNGCTGPNGWFCWGDIMVYTKLNETQRAIYPSYESVGLSAIAVSYRGAQRLLYYLSYKELVDTLDYSIADLLRKGALRGWTVTPPLLSEWKTHGKSDSDLKKVGLNSGLPGNMNGVSAGVAHSARKALTENLEGEDYWKNEAPYWNRAHDNRAHDNEKSGTGDVKVGTDDW
ncbi:hypothetical protein V1520DRAFT_385010 [Lipomyces starkeyi]|uniref:Glycosyltransferase family 25 protein n=1 Tax=Lipomyces starkeyi NRRL Y-11557 TaxID=675824 RepID=A0A1E3Q6Q3_LIPST|nr:hypothetical protein LIPSTDRAFT_309508 [Lipomyces starkeyi NRRL Y-11557]